MNEIIRVLFLIFLLYRNVEAIVRIDPLVDTKVGLIRGLKATDGDYAMFLGIPFGKVDPANPFGISTPYPPFEEVFEAYDDSAVCPQTGEEGTIECLNLNIYVPSSANSQNRLPVLVWIYGGGFAFGFARRDLYGPKYLVRHDVILVALNYRVGPYGFMCLDTPEVPGNQGLKDQLLALRWIKDNIESFGGDVNKITIFGESAGSMSVDLHLHSPQEKLYRSVILQSGTANIPTLMNHEPGGSSALTLAGKLGLETSDVSQALSFLATADPNVIIAAANDMDPFLPCVENDFEGVEKFLVDYSYNLDVPKAKGIPILIGFNAEEWLAGYIGQSDEYFSRWNNFHDNLDSTFDFEDNDLNKMAEFMRHFYIGDEAIEREVKRKLAEFDSDFVFNYPTYRTIDKYMDNDAAKVFFYMFSYVGGRNLMRWQYNITEDVGAVHADELGYLFDISYFQEQPSDSDQVIIDRITTLWTNFAKYGDPTPETTDLLPVKWEAITSSDSPLYYLNIDSELTLGKRPYHDRMAFWELFYKRNEKFQKGYREN